MAFSLTLTSAVPACRSVSKVAVRGINVSFFSTHLPALSVKISALWRWRSGGSVSLRNATLLQLVPALIHENNEE